MLTPSPTMLKLSTIYSIENKLYRQSVRSVTFENDSNVLVVEIKTFDIMNFATVYNGQRSDYETC